MSAGYQAVQWNGAKRGYDLLIAVAVLGYVGTFVLVSKLAWRGGHAISDEVLVIRGLGTCAYLMLHVVLCIGPVSRLDRRWLPLLYNRRHLGVATFLVGLGHGALNVGYYHGFGRIHPLVSLLTSNTQYGSLRAFPFEILGVGGLLILFVMAATSHDFWLKNLGKRAWKSLHMMVYVAWALLVMHVALGALQAERSWVYVVLVAGGVLVVSGLHVTAGWKENGRETAATGVAEWVDAGMLDDLTEGRGRVVGVAGGERVAVFRYGGKVCALSNVCAHQGGPLGEGRIIDGCVTCPWHGYQYRPEDGKAPPPFTEEVATYPVEVVGGRVRVCVGALEEVGCAR